MRCYLDISYINVINTAFGDIIYLDMGCSPIDKYIISTSAAGKRRASGCDNHYYRLR